ncbi:hypothetical protein GCM10010924_41240 [Rhizobium wenxiniae]|nr:hypothetical protein GCM10010924_41240 [Rhizobium wenxiniae]
MAGIPEAKANARRNGLPTLAFDRLKAFERLICVIRSIDWLNLLVASLTIAPVPLIDFDFLDVASIGKHDTTEIDRGWRCIDRAGKAALGKFRQQA